MSLKGRWIGSAVMTLALGAFLAGCGASAPCPVAEDMLEAARGKASETQRLADEAVSRKQDLESQIQSKRARVRELEEQKIRIESDLTELLGA